MCKALRKDVMTKKLDRRAEIKKAMDELKYELDEIEDSVKAAMEKDGVDEFVVGPYKVTYKEVTSNRFDSTLFKKDNADLYEEYKRPSTCKRFIVK